MSKAVKRSIVLFFVASVLIAAILFFFPIALFDGEVTWKEGTIVHTDTAPLSLSYFIGIGYDEADMQGILDFHLTAQGWATALIFILGIPGLFAYRMYLKATLPKED